MSDPAGGAAAEAPAPVHRTTASDRFLRLLTVVPWIAGQDGPRIAEVCERFGMSRKQLLDDLQVIPLVGLPPYTPDTLIDVTIEGDRVWLRFADVFARPLRLTPEQGLALVAAGAAWRDLPGADAAGPLATALDKVAAVLDVDPDEAVSVALGNTPPGLLDTLRTAVSERRRARIDYYAYGRDQRSLRDVDAYGVFAEEGAWYLRAFCHQAGGERLFRVDRIYGADLLDATFVPPATAGTGTRPHGTEVFTPGPEVPRVTLELAPAARWVVETYPVEQVEEREDGGLRVRLAVSAKPWLERLLVRLGPDARVVDADDEGLRHAGADAARRLLARYREQH
ncbi:MAG TPA: WYL domain-containing protein [Acidimicrobiales bacterium]|nr:WYL domain-containing protein [Acidimicrobiales bacterium]